MRVSGLKSKLSRFPKENLLWGKTPVTRADNLSRELGVELYIKRDDLTGLALGGNKSRKLEYLIGDALARGVDTFITIGGVNSNHALQAAVAARKKGMKPALVLKGSDESKGNLLLDRMMTEEVHIHQVESSKELNGYMEKLAGELRDAGKNPYACPLGGSSPVGALGYVEAAVEITEYREEIGAKLDYVVAASSSGGTMAGLTLGLKLLAPEIKPLGIGVGDPPEEVIDDVYNLIQGLGGLLDIGDGYPGDISREEVRSSTVDGYGFGGYGSVDKEVVDIIGYAAARAGFFLDPVYSGKGFYGLVDLVKNGTIPQGSSVLFVHTGGLGGLFQYQDIMAGLM